MKKLCVFILTGLLSMISHAGASDPIVGKWQTFDDRTGAKRAIIKIAYNAKKGTYYGNIVKRNHAATDASGLKVFDTCKKCPAPFTNKKIDGMVVLWNLKKNTGKDASKFPYKGGYILDPTRGRIYNLQGEVSKSGKALKGRASLIGAKGIGRKQTWMKVD